MRLFAAALLSIALDAGAVDLHLPFRGRWFVAQGGDTPNVNHHMQVRSQRFGLDFLKVGGAGGRELFRGSGRALEGGRYAFVAHLRKGSVRVVPGQYVAGSQELGRCGNSGNSDAPHVHLHVQDQPALGQGEGQPITFAVVNVELSGKTFYNVAWPLIRGLFVWD